MAGKAVLTGTYFMNGDEACCEGAIAAGCRFFGGYPITPATEVAERMSRRLPEVGPIRFGALYRPATWVSGDIYDVVRLDETHVGFYVADAVGHGMPAALLTMFIKKALLTKRILGHTYEILPPHVSLQ